MSGISRFFAPVKCAGTATTASAGTHSSNSTNDAPPKAKNESIVDGVPIDKDGWQIFPSTIANTTNGDVNSVVCIEIDDDDDDGNDDGDGAEDDQLKTGSAPAQSPMPAKSEAAAPESQEVASAQGENMSGKSKTDDESANDADISTTSTCSIHEPSAEVRTGASNGTDAEPTAADAMNPFALFAFGSRGDSLSVAHQRSDTVKRPLSSSAVSEVETSTKRHQQQKDTKKRRRTSTKNKCDNNDYVQVCQLPVEQREEIRTKWQSLGDPNESLEVRRFQVLVAARLHAQSREPTVRAAMDNLRKYFSEQEGVGVEGGTLNAKNLAKADPKEIAKQIPSILFANVKAEHVVKAAKEVCSRFGGTVPQTQHGLKELTGIGPKLADILAFVNSRKAYENIV